MAAPIAAIIGVSVAATLFLFWLIYVHPASDAAAVRYAFLPNLNALLNGLSGPLEGPSAYFCKHPMKQYTDDQAYNMVEAFIRANSAKLRAVGP